MLHLIDYLCKKKKSNDHSYNYYKFSDYLLVFFLVIIRLLLCHDMYLSINNYVRRHSYETLLSIDFLRGLILFFTSSS